ncbi:RDD family protein [Flammeovirga kamogawensis]|uniref:RDD family protein n=1 Tax=Flammeovirga kamogawensis TaxID=373891 RepID=A0ABX8H3L9_9BACT|nr:RDD family protein [Flammeovirga kamogawensis]MBB6460502.1 putative RDD family membrane protein YckC [Flammeovirga kamogawensis]QWG10308.1 RDD family protein [Flammeovirga kamogawensis]TRX64756.1 RDD family protein [Flammeovirga kamogawensis]
MESISFQNSQNVNIQFQKATITQRIGAFLIDLLIISAIFLVPLIVLHKSDTMFVVWAVIMTIVSLTYNLLCEVFLEGQSLGKRVMDIRVASIDGNSVTMSQYGIRWVFRLIDIALLQGSIAVFTILLGGKGQRLGDILAGTIVISEKKNINKKLFKVPEFPEDYEPEFYQASNLSDQQIKVIRKGLTLNYSTDQQIILNKLVDKLKVQLAIDSDMRHKEFLNQLLNDYYFLTITSNQEQY